MTDGGAVGVTDGGEAGGGAEPVAARPLRIATWNVNSLRARMPRVEEWVAEHEPDVLCLQETKQPDRTFPAELFASIGYETAHHGDGQWNGVAIASRIGLVGVQRGFGSAEDSEGCRMVAATCGEVRVHSVYVPNGRSLDSAHYAAKLAWLARLRCFLGETCDPARPVAVCGDFNVAPHDRDVWDPAELVGCTHVSGPERAALGDVEAWGLVDVVRALHGDEELYSWWDYRGGAFHRGHGMRIDLVLVTRVLADRCVGAWIDREARKGVKPSDHAPVVVEIGAVGPG